jgi:uncharacterized protein YqgC (DUF456 family)
MHALTVVAGLIMLVGLIGTVVPLLPGLPLVWGAVLLWATAAQSTAAWVVFGIATTLALSGLLLAYLLPGRRMAAAGVTTSSTLAGAALGIVGFLVIPVVGAFLGFALGVYVAEHIRLGTHSAAWSATEHALKAIGWSMGIELLTGLAIATAWLIGVSTTA